MLVILTVGSPVLLLSVDEKIESLLFPIFSLGCQNFMNRKDPNFSDLTGAIQGSLEKKVLVITLNGRLSRSFTRTSVHLEESASYVSE